VGRKAGITEEQLHDLACFERSTAFRSGEKLALKLTVALTRTPASVDDQLFADLRAEFSEPQLVELATAIADGLEANKRGDVDLATARLGRAVALAHQAGNEETARLLASVVDVVDEATGTVRLKKKVDAAAEMALDTRSTKTVRVRKG